MALDKLIDSNQLDKDLKLIADTIRSKNGTSENIEFPNGFVNAVENIETGGKIQTSKTVTPSESQKTVKPDAGYDGLGQVIVNKISSSYVGSGVSKLYSNSYTPSTSNQYIYSGNYISGTQTIRGDENLIPENIKSGVSIFNVDGSYTGSAAEPTFDSSYAKYTSSDGLHWSFAEGIHLTKQDFLNGLSARGRLSSSESGDIIIYLNRTYSDSLSLETRDSSGATSSFGLSIQEINDYDSFEASGLEYTVESGEIYLYPILAQLPYARYISTNGSDWFYVEGKQLTIQDFSYKMTGLGKVLLSDNNFTNIIITDINDTPRITYLAYSNDTYVDSGLFTTNDDLNYFYTSGSFGGTVKSGTMCLYPYSDDQQGQTTYKCFYGEYDLDNRSFILDTETFEFNDLGNNVFICGEFYSSTQEGEEKYIFGGLLNGLVAIVKFDDSGNNNHEVYTGIESDTAEETVVLHGGNTVTFESLDIYRGEIYIICPEIEIPLSTERNYECAKYIYNAEDSEGNINNAIFDYSNGSDYFTNITPPMTSFFGMDSEDGFIIFGKNGELFMLDNLLSNNLLFADDAQSVETGKLTITAGDINDLPLDNVQLYLYLTTQ